MSALALPFRSPPIGACCPPVGATVTRAPSAAASSSLGVTMLLQPVPHPLPTAAPARTRPPRRCVRARASALDTLLAAPVDLHAVSPDTSTAVDALCSTQPPRLTAALLASADGVWEVQYAPHISVSLPLSTRG